MTADDYGRVLLLDSMEFVVVRMWKGYRNAQCGWIEVVEEDAPEGDSRERGSGEDGKEAVRGEGRRCAQTALCLCIFAPRRGILEVSGGWVQAAVWQAVYRRLVLGGGVLFYSSGLFRMAQRLPHFKLERPAGECTRLSVICTLSNALLSAKLAGLFVCTFPGDFHCLCVIVHMSVNDWCSGSSQDIALIVLLSLACNQGCGDHLWEAECHYRYQ